MGYANTAKDDEDFFGYVSLHSQTERALFAGSDILYLLKLAGEEYRDIYPKNFYELHSLEAETLIKKARDAASPQLRLPLVV